MTTLEFTAAVRGIERAKKVKREAIEQGQPVPEKVRDLLRAEAAANKATRDKKPDDWKRDIGALKPVALRNMVASVVWWDFFGHRPARRPWRHLDAWLNAKVDVEFTREELEIGLALAGYTPTHAHRRLMGGTYYTTASAKAA